MNSQNTQALPIKAQAGERLGPANCSVRTLNRRGRWLLTYAVEIQPLMVCTTIPLPCFENKDLPDMGTLNGLVRRGWMVKEHPGIYKLTEAGIEAAASLKAPNDGR